VLFSSDTVANAINAQFEPVWVSVREVPTVTIDFGNGSKILRTLNGNVATYALDAEGNVIDILPGIYLPDAYLEQLDQMAKLHRYITFAPEKRHFERLSEYHSKQASLIGAGKEPGKIVVDFLAAVSKARIENPLKFAIGDAAVILGGNQTSAPKSADSKEAETLRGWKEMREDTKINETIHRKAIHEHLAKAGKVTSNDVTKWLYKNILHADLDDPTLGLGAILNANYPFAEEDKKAKLR
jgi:hypothetical protein